MAHLNGRAKRKRSTEEAIGNEVKGKQVEVIQFRCGNCSIVTVYIEVKLNQKTQQESA